MKLDRADLAELEKLVILAIAVCARLTWYAALALAAAAVLGLAVRVFLTTSGLG